MGLRSRLIISVVGLATFILVAWSSLLAFNGVREQRGHAEDQAIQALTLLSVPASTELAQRRVEQLDALLGTATERDTKLVWIGVVDDQGRVIAHSDHARYGQVQDDAFTMEAIRTNAALTERAELGKTPILLTAVPVETRSEVGAIRWGTLVAAVSMVEVEGTIAELSRNLAFASLLMLGVMGISLWLLLSRQVIRPLTSLNAAAQAIKDGDLSARVSQTDGDGAAIDELELLRGVFNEMARQIEGQTSILEGRVARRTAELEAANSELARINQRLSRAVARLADIAKTDGLTGLLNHRSFQEKLSLELQRCLRQEHPLSIIMIDVDHFKAYNDMHGHPAGDFVLKEVARLFKDNLREVDVVARYGGEEFAVVLLDTPKGAAGLVAEKLRLAVLEQEFPHADRSQPEGRMSISIGVSSFPDDGLSPAELIETADLSLYEAKRRGRNRVMLAGELLSMYSKRT